MYKIDCLRIIGSDEIMDNLTKYHRKKKLLVVVNGQNQLDRVDNSVLGFRLGDEVKRIEPNSRKRNSYVKNITMKLSTGPHENHVNFDEYR
jgi:hypothetical protein